MVSRIRWTAEQCRTYNRGMRLLFEGFDKLATLKTGDMSTEQCVLLADTWDSLFQAMELLGEAGEDVLGWRTKQLIRRQYD